MFLVEFDTLDLETFVICGIESVDPVDDLCLTNQIYSVLLNASEVKEITEMQNAHLKMLLEDDETRPRGCKHPTPPCALAKILPETTVRASIRQIENASPATETFLTFSTNLLYPCMYSRGESYGASSEVKTLRGHLISHNIDRTRARNSHVLSE